MATHALIMNARGSTWDYIPDDMWCNILNRFAAKVCDGVSFHSVATAADVSRLAVFDDHTPAYVRQASYKPASIPPSVPNPDDYQHPVAVFRFDEWIASLILQEPLNNWCVTNDRADSDELIFWTGDRMKLQAIPYEGQAYFDNLTSDELQCLILADTRIESNLGAV